MLICMPKTSEFASNFRSNDVICAYVSQKVENGYVVNIGGSTVFARSALDLSEGDLLRLKVIEASSSQIVFKVVNQKLQATKLPVNHMPFNFSDTPESLAALNLLYKLNFPIEEKQIKAIAELFNKFIDIQKTKTVKEGTRSDDILEHLALKALNLIHSKGDDKGIVFSAIPATPYRDNIFLKISKQPSKKGSKPYTQINFILKTKNLGAVKVELIYADRKVTASSIFESKEALKIVKKALDSNKAIPTYLKNMKLKLGKISFTDFFFSQVKDHPIASINIMV